MQKHFIRFLLIITLTGAALLIANKWLMETQYQAKFHSAYYLLHIFFYLLTLAIHAIMLKAGRKRPQIFVTYFMGTVSVKLFISLTGLAAYLFFHRDETIPFALSFLGLYLVYTAVEIIEVLQVLKKQK